MKDTKHKALASLKQKYQRLAERLIEIDRSWIEFGGEQGIKIVQLKNQVADLSAQLRQCEHDKHDLQSKPCGQSCAPTPGVAESDEYLRIEVKKARELAMNFQRDAAQAKGDTVYWKSTVLAINEKLEKAEEKVDNLSLALAISVLAHLGFGAWAAFSHIEQIRLFLQ